MQVRRMTVSLVLCAATAGSAMAQLWTPSNITTAAWFDASDTDTITPTPSVGQWNDKSGNGNHATQGTAGNQPVLATNPDLNKPGLLFNDTEKDRLIAANSSELNFQNAGSWFFVYQETGQSPNNIITCRILGDGNPSMTFGTSNTENPQFQTSEDSNAGVTVYSDVSGLTTPTLASMRFSTALSTQRIAVNGGAEQSATPESQVNPDGGEIRIGGQKTWSDRFHDGYIHEIILVDAYVSDADRLKLEGYLAHKWGLEGYLPTGHTYKAAAPAGFTPTNVLLAAWYDASDADTIICNTPVSQWKDKSGSNNHLAQGTEANKPKFINNYIEFDGVNDHLTRSPNLTEAVTILGVVRTYVNNAVTDANKSWMSQPGGSNPDYWMAARTAVDQLGGNIVLSGGFYDGVSKSAARNTDHIHALISPDATNPIWVRIDGGVEEGTSGDQDKGTLLQKGTELVVGRQKNVSTRFHEGRVYEIIIVNSRIETDDSDFLKLEGYLAHKWGLEGNLPANHRYKNLPPGTYGTVIYVK